MTAGQHGHRTVVGGRVVQQQSDGEHVVVGVRIEGRILVDLDGGADATALEVQLAVMKADRWAEQLGDDVEDRRLERHPRVERIVVSRVFDPPHDRSGGAVTRVHVEHGVAACDAARTVDEDVGDPPQLGDALGVDEAWHGEIAIAMVARDLFVREVTLRGRRHRRPPDVRVSSLEPTGDRSLHVGDTVSIGGRLYTGRDAVHHRLHSGVKPPVDLEGQIIYHCGPVVLEEWNKKAQASPWGVVPRTQDPILPAEKIRRLEDEFIPKELQRDYAKTFGHDRH